MTVTGTGFGTSTEELNLQISSTNICSEATVTGYGTFTCLTNAMEISSSSTIELKTASGAFSCGNTNTPSDCAFEQLNASSPTLSSATISDASTIVFSGSDFPTADYDAVATFHGVESSSTVSDSASTVTATFDLGVPISDTGVAPVLRFDHQSLNEQLVAINGGVTLTNAMSISDSTSGLSCSFQGGCAYTVTATGLASLLYGTSENRIDVCGNTCTIDTSASDST